MACLSGWCSCREVGPVGVSGWCSCRCGCHHGGDRQENQEVRHHWHITLVHAVPTFTTAPLLPLLLPPPVLPLPLLPLLAVVVPLPLLAVVVPPLPLPEARSAQTGGASVTGGPAGQPWGW